MRMYWLLAAASMMLMQMAILGHANACVYPYPAGTSECLNYTVPLDHFDASNPNKISLHFNGYIVASPVPVGIWNYVVLSAGCQMSNPVWQDQIKAFTGPQATVVGTVFVDPRGSGFSSKVMCPDDPTGQNPVPSAACAKWATTNNINDFYNLKQMAGDLQFLLNKFQVAYPNNQIRLVGADLFGNAWIQAWTKWFPSNNVTTNKQAAGYSNVGITIFNSPPALGQYDFFQSLVQNPDSNVRTALAQCSQIPSCAAMFGGQDLNQLLGEVMLSAKQNELACNAKLVTQWSTVTMGTEILPSPIFTFYSKLLNMLTKNPNDVFADWPEQMPSLIPGVLYRIQRCNDNDVIVLMQLYKKLSAFAIETQSPNVKGVYQWKQCYVSPVLKFNVIFNDLLKGVPPSAATLLGSENRNTVLPSPEYVNTVRALYDAWPINKGPNQYATGVFNGGGIIAFFAVVGMLNPVVSYQHSLYAMGAYYAMASPALPAGQVMNYYGTGQKVAPILIPTGGTNVLYNSPTLNVDKTNRSCALAAIHWSSTHILPLSTIDSTMTLPPCASTLSAIPQFDFTGAKASSKKFRMTFLVGGSGLGDPFQFTDVIALPATYPPDPIGFQTTTPLPPGQTTDPPTTPLPAGATYAPPTPVPPPTPDQVIINETGTVTVNKTGLVVGIIFSLILLVVIAVVVYKCVQRRLNDPNKRNFDQEVYGSQSNIQAPLNQPQQQNIYRNVA